MLDCVIAFAPYVVNSNPPLAPAILKSCMESEGLTVQTVDFNAEFLQNDSLHLQEILEWMRIVELAPTMQAYKWYRKQVKAYSKRIIALDPKWIAISLLTQDSQRFTEDFCFYIRILAPHIKIMLGGSGVRVVQHFYNQQFANVMLDNDLADCVCISEGERVISKIILEDLTGIVSDNQLDNQTLSTLPFANFDNYSFDLYSSSTMPGGTVALRNDKFGITLPITASKGCVRDCTFCDVGKFWPKFKFRSGQSVADEMIYQYKKHNATYFVFTDSLINGSVSAFKDMNLALAKELPNTVKFYGQFICRPAESMAEDEFKTAAVAGLDLVNIGIESGSEQVRYHMKKKFSNADIHHTSDMCIKYNIRQVWNLLVGYPTEFENDFQDTLDLINKYGPYGRELITIAPVGVFQLLNGTPISEEHYVDTLGLQSELINGYKEYNWMSLFNPNNTLPVRVDRFNRLVDLVLSYDISAIDNDQLSTMQSIYKKQLEYYYEKKRTRTTT